MTKDNILDKHEIASLGASLRAIEPKLLKPSQKKGNTKLWFQGDEPYFDIFFELNNDDILWFEFTLRGKSLSWDKKRLELKTGNTNELSIHDASFYAASKTIENDITLDLDFIYLVKCILQTRAEEPIFAKTLALLN